MSKYYFKQDMLRFQLICEFRESRQAAFVLIAWADPGVVDKGFSPSPRLSKIWDFAMVKFV